MSWSTPLVIRTRREALGLSQSDVASALGVTSSLLSQLESGKRIPTDAQVAALSSILRLPVDLLLLGSGRLPEDIQGALAFGTAEVVAAVRQQTEARVVRYPDQPSSTPMPKSTAMGERAESIPERLDVRKATTSYRAHSYHTKVPPEAIRPFIRAFTAPGDTILDPFCGSGMTGVAALIEGRNALLSDLSPAAVHIARNYTTPCDPRAFGTALRAVETLLAPTIDWLYRPIGTQQLVEYTTWSDVFRCPACDRAFAFWDAVRQSGGTNGDRVACPSCGHESRKTALEWIGEKAVQSHTSEGSNRINSHDPTREELALIDGASAAPIPYWTPQVPFGSEREMWRAGHRTLGIDDVTGFYTKRNLHALAALRHAIATVSEGRVREALLFAFTAAVNRASKRYQWNAKRPTNVMTGTLYISSLRYEWNVWSLFRRKAADVRRYYESFPNTISKTDVFQRSATDLGCLPDGSLDLIFMDPPFGSNIFYADSSLLWDAWLGTLTDQQSEIVVNRHRSMVAGGKNLENYGDLMRQSFAESARVLKQGGRAVLAFSNSDDKVWQAIQNALREVGLETESAHVLNKGQPSIKGVKGVNGKENVTTLDLMLCLKHRSVSRGILTASPPVPDTLVGHVIRDMLCAPPGHRTDEIYSAVIRKILAAHYSLSGVTMPWIEQKCIEAGARKIKGRWIIQSKPKSSTFPHDFVEGYEANLDQLPSSSGDTEIDKPLGQVRVSGGRNSALYMAHSYHTKVPPESITPFIEHYTQPGDVVLDPFCGSGMTGVAAALTGRRAIVSDLSPAAIHLAWNHSRPCDPDALVREFDAIASRLAGRFRDMYKTTHSDGTAAYIHWTLWSTRHRCSQCRHMFLLWDVMDRQSGRLGSTILCPHCNTELRRSALPSLSSEPAWIAYESEDGRRHEKPADRDDRRHASSFDRASISTWYPTTPLGPDREMYIRCALQRQDISSLPDFYTARNLEALSLIWREITAVTDDRIKRALAFAFTNTAWHGTRMRRFNARGGQRPLTGTLYIPQLSSEANVLEVMRNKIQQLQRYYRSYRPQGDTLPATIIGSATNLSSVLDGSIDYIFTDPPFGSNIFYADCNLIWESWLGRLTDTTDEAVVNRSLSIAMGGKSLTTYATLITDAMREMHRVLKGGGWATVVFHNTDAAVWQAIHNAASDAGFEFHEAASLDRQQQSHKGYKGRSGSEDVAHFDVVFNLRKPEKPKGKSATAKNGDIDVRSLVIQLARNPEIASRGIQGVHAEVMRQMASSGGAVYVDYAEIRTLWEQAMNADTTR